MNTNIDGADNQSFAAKREKAVRVIKYALFSASITPALFGGALAAWRFDGAVDMLNFILVVAALFVGQAGGDYLYYYFSHRHTDSRDSHTKIFAGWRPLFSDRLPKERGTLYAGVVCLLIDLAVGIYFTIQIGYGILIFAALGGLVAIFFTPLMLRGLKEPIIFITFGPLCVAGTYYVLTSEISSLPFIASFPIAFLVTVVAYLKGARFELDDSGGDQVVLKLDKARIITLSTLAYASLVAFAIFSTAPLPILAGLVAIPLSISVSISVKKQSSGIQDYLWAVVRSIFALLTLGAFSSIGLLLSN